MARDCYDDCIAFLDHHPGELLCCARSAKVFSTTRAEYLDHGEVVPGDHQFFGHGNAVYLDEIGVLLVMLTPAHPRAASWSGRGQSPRPAGHRRRPARSRGRLTVPGHSLAADWRLGAGTETLLASPAISERVNAAASELQTGLRAFQLSIVAQGRHYFGGDSGREHLYDLNSDPYEQVNLCELPGRRSTRTGLSADAFDGSRPTRLDRSGKCLLWGPTSDGLNPPASDRG